jgi:hypothetical protein
MWSDRVVFIAPLLNGDLGFLQAVEDFLVEALVTQFAVEGLAIAAVLGAAGLDMERRCAKPGQPVADHLRGHLRTVAGPNVLLEVVSITSTIRSEGRISTERQSKSKACALAAARRMCERTS